MALAVVGTLVAWARHGAMPPPVDGPDDLPRVPSERIDEIELARVRSILQRR
jgi:hypothetical protein